MRPDNVIPDTIEVLKDKFKFGSYAPLWRVMRARGLSICLATFRRWAKGEHRPFKLQEEKFHEIADELREV